MKSIVVVGLIYITSLMFSIVRLVPGENDKSNGISDLISILSREYNSASFTDLEHNKLMKISDANRVCIFLENLDIFIPLYIFIIYFMINFTLLIF
ncbi:hypothetical protein [Caminicella sporogenes]|nr:hypothetical protein [Caminicella sporogenes]